MVVDKAVKMLMQALSYEPGSIFLMLAGCLAILKSYIIEDNGVDQAKRARLRRLTLCQRGGSVNFALNFDSGVLPWRHPVPGPPMNV
jgi:hypothetical protein